MQLPLKEHSGALSRLFGTLPLFNRFPPRPSDGGPFDMLNPSYPLQWPSKTARHPSPHEGGEIS